MSCVVLYTAGLVYICAHANDACAMYMHAYIPLGPFYPDNLTILFRGSNLPCPSVQGIYTVCATVYDAWFTAISPHHNPSTASHSTGCSQARYPAHRAVASGIPTYRIMAAAENAATLALGLEACAARSRSAAVALASA